MSGVAIRIVVAEVHADAESIFRKSRAVTEVDLCERLMEEKSRKLYFKKMKQVEKKIPFQSKAWHEKMFQFFVRGV